MNMNACLTLLSTWSWFHSAHRRKTVLDINAAESSQ